MNRPLKPSEQKLLESLRANAPQVYEVVLREMQAHGITAHQALRKIREQHQSRLLAPYEELPKDSW